MPLPDFYFRNGAARYIASVYLKLCREIVLSKSRLFAQAPDVVSNSSFDLSVHTLLPFAPK